MHFSLSLLFLILIIVTAFIYLLLAYVLASIIFKLLRHVILKKKNLESGMSIKSVLTPYINKKVLTFLLALILAMSLSTYMRQRDKWMGPGSANPEAKEYWVSGQVLYILRMIMFTGLNPDNPICRPANTLQRTIYETGIRYIPETDGERGIWMSNWFVYPFARHMSETFLASNERTSYRMQKVLDDTWYAITEISNKRISDQKMREHVYLKQFPNLVFYYALHENYYAEKRRGSLREIARDNKHFLRSKALFLYSENFFQGANVDTKMKAYLRANAYDKGVVQVAMLMELADIILGKIWNSDFKCNDEYVKKYTSLRNRVLTDKDSILKDVGNNKELKGLRNLVVNTGVAKLCRVVLADFCSLKVAGIEDLSWFSDHKDPVVASTKRVRSQFYSEMQLIKENLK